MQPSEPASQSRLNKEMLNGPIFEGGIRPTPNQVRKIRHAFMIDYLKTQVLDTPLRVIKWMLERWK